MSRKQETIEETLRLEFPGNFPGNFRKPKMMKTKAGLHLREKSIGNFPIYLQLFPTTLYEGRKQETFLKYETLQKEIFQENYRDISQAIYDF